MRLIIIALCIIGYCSCGRVPYIIGGTDAAKGDWPWMMSLQWNGGSSYIHQCGASLITDQYAITAAHCFAHGYGDYRLLVGASNIEMEDAEYIINVGEYIIHQDYDDESAGIPNDIAIVILEEPVSLENDYISVINLPNKEEDFVGNDNCWIVGWGLTSDGGSSPSDILQQANVAVIDNPTCQERLSRRMDGWVMETHICNDESIASPCSMDSGGPLHCDRSGTGDEWVIAGALSWGDDPCSEYPAAYTRISEYLDWISDIVPDL